MESKEIDRLEDIVKARRRDVPEEIDTTEIAHQFQAGMENRRSVSPPGFNKIYLIQKYPTFE